VEAVPEGVFARQPESFAHANHIFLSPFLVQCDGGTGGELKIVEDRVGQNWLAFLSHAVRPQVRFVALDSALRRSHTNGSSPFTLSQITWVFVQCLIQVTHDLLL
jgi:hypothetical protein